jgi:hypothetical protein
VNQYSPFGFVLERLFLAPDQKSFCNNIGIASTVTFDYQFIVNPAYNRDRGPVSVISARVHAEF